MSIGSLFSGIGGLDLAAESLGFGPVEWHCENDRHPAKVLEVHWPDVPNAGDITTIDWSRVPPVDVIVGGFPCVDISNAGNRVGIEGAKSGLWVHMAEAIRVLRPHVVIVENVAALLYRGFDRVLGDLAGARYDTRWTSLRASDVGAPHQRERVFLLAVDADRGPWLRWHSPPVAGEAGPPPRPDSGTDWGDFAPAVHHWERIFGRLAPPPTLEHRGGSRLNPRMIEWLMGLPDGWVTDIGLPYGAQCRALGNAVVPAQAVAALTTLLSEQGAD